MHGLMHELWTNMFALGVPLAEKILRPIIVYIVLIENGKIHEHKLKKELITKAELAAAARKQGFESLSEVQQCVLEPGGTLSFTARKPATEDIRHQELLKKFDTLTQEIARLRKLQPPATA